MNTASVATAVAVLISRIGTNEEVYANAIAAIAKKNVVTRKKRSPLSPLPTTAIHMKNTMDTVGNKKYLLTEECCNGIKNFSIADKRLGYTDRRTYQCATIKEGQTFNQSTKKFPINYTEYNYCKYWNIRKQRYMFYKQRSKKRKRQDITKID